MVTSCTRVSNSRLETVKYVANKRFIPWRLNFIWQRLGTLCLFRCQHIKFRRQGIVQNKAYKRCIYLFGTSQHFSVYTAGRPLSFSNCRCRSIIATATLSDGEDRKNVTQLWAGLELGGGMDILQQVCAGRKEEKREGKEG